MLTGFTVPACQCTWVQGFVIATAFVANEFVHEQLLKHAGVAVCNGNQIGAYPYIKRWQSFFLGLYLYRGNFFEYIQIGEPVYRCIFGMKTVLNLGENSAEAALPPRAILKKANMLSIRLGLPGGRKTRPVSVCSKVCQNVTNNHAHRSLTSESILIGFSWLFR